MTTDATPPPEGGEDWAAKATGAVESVVAIIRDHSLRPALTVLRVLLVALLGAGLGALAFVLGVAGVVRVLTADAFAGRVWISDFVVGGLVSLLGLVLLAVSRRVGREPRHA
ncbi:MAG: hypothetical protein M0014_00750 [Actinomycetota bacterium]|jgi:hypothetical protein|nr:hypothetical protein [Actinomycetota bacterium]